MSNSAFVATLLLDLNSGLVDTGIRLTYPRVLEMVSRIHGLRGFGLVGARRLIARIDYRGMASGFSIYLPLFAKNSGRVDLCPEVYDLLFSDESKENSPWHATKAIYVKKATVKKVRSSMEAYGPTIRSAYVR